MEFKMSRFSLGFWRSKEWNYNSQQLKDFVNQSIELGITTIDHADIYGQYSCEDIFGSILKEEPSLRQKLQLITKCGIKIVTKRFPEFNIHSYDTSKAHIIWSAENSLRNMNTDYLDVLLIHRPDPLMNADEVAEAMIELKQCGKVLNFGVSNFLPRQFNLLQSRLDFPLVTNQIEASVLCTEHFNNGNIDFLQEKRISPMVWSPFAGGRIFHDNTEQANRVRSILFELAYKYQVEIDAVAASWLLIHPVNFVIVLGTRKIDRIKTAMKGLTVNLTREEWFKIWVASHGRDIP
ncbi:MAG: oxidoreductase aldo/keto reductase family [Ignavibacteria bacterium]|nr:MAG: oxidoreductase aldo/keto reductase family [Ignavibacteria bacterium]KAF0161306.1 MAG: oxidoreductase aldo/keto reductase family [Ignavibacteria bacterium]